MKKGFTLTELLLTFLILSMIVIIGVPTLQKVKLNRKALYISAFNTVDKVINELIFDTRMFSTGELDDTLCSKFADKLNINGTYDCTTSTVPDTPNFITENGMRWYGFQNAFSASNCPSGVDGNCMVVNVDIDGQSSGENKAGSDILSILISSRGKITTTGTKQLEYLK